MCWIKINVFKFKNLRYYNNSKMWIIFFFWKLQLELFDEVLYRADFLKLKKTFQQILFILLWSQIWNPIDESFTQFDLLHWHCCMFYINFNTSATSYGSNLLHLLQVFNKIFYIDIGYVFWIKFTTLTLATSLYQIYFNLHYKVGWEIE